MRIQSIKIKSMDDEPPMLRSYANFKSNKFLPKTLNYFNIAAIPGKNRLHLFA